MISNVSKYKQTKNQKSNQQHLAKAKLVFVMFFSSAKMTKQTGQSLKQNQQNAKSLVANCTLSRRIKMLKASRRKNKQKYETKKLFYELKVKILFYFQLVKFCKCREIGYQPVGLLELLC